MSSRCPAGSYVEITFADGSKERVASSRGDINFVVTKVQEDGSPTGDQPRAGDNPLGGNCKNVIYVVKGRGEAKLNQLPLEPTEQELEFFGPISSGGDNEAIDAAGFNGARHFVIHRDGKTGIAGYGAVDSGTYKGELISIKRKDGQPDICSDDPNAPQPEGSEPKCKIRVYDGSGTLYEKAGKCPIRARKGCEGDCPEGQMRCETESYPGFCCFDC